ncbi:para-aminobenzoate synthetase component 1 [Dysgonomonas alginatilytica]|uniref:Para-aminobenzoate synthetase component 1 n=1 Tax=Dysgonomonas alginatilytica TaxID=1605892 RepID=A0A2V3PT88_9BACT|nr:aminodeoxychorismate synthase component I [Dysgonomonas alginatilytica]PXV68947.1 para-aminobenzoate synthetase component 1 [Dysgonomonas alginatilytica]
MQFYRDTDDIRLKMNEAGSANEPFLFGINYEMSEGFFIENPLLQNDLLFQLKGIGNKKTDEVSNVSADLTYTPISESEYQHKFDIVHKGLRRGDSFLTNLTVKTPIATNISLQDIFDRSKAPYQLYMPDRFVCFSPERFVRIADGRISSNPMKGTIDAGIENAEQIILNDFKETAEHNTIVDLIRNDLSIVADHVRVERFRYIDRIRSRNKEILQVSSEIMGDLPADYHSHLGDILFKLLPAGSISGAPKTATVDLIRSAEGEDRGYYTGIFGYYDGTALDSAVLIRFIEQTDRQMYFRSGGGITAYSKCSDEYQEVLNKIYFPFI